MKRIDWAIEVSAWFTGVGALLLILILTTIARDNRREEEANRREQEHEYIIPLEAWEEFQNCIEPHPSDGVCDSCWKAIIVDKYHITTESHE